MKRFYESRYFGLTFFFVLNVMFFWQFFLRSEIAVDPNPLYRTYPWRAAAAQAPVHGADQVRYLHQIDSTLMIYPLREEVRKQIVSGHIPLWTDLIFCGAPLLANQVGAFDFLSLLLLPFSSFHAFGLQMILQLTFAGWFLFLFCELLGLSRPAALFAGVAYMWNGFFFRNLGVITAVGTIGWQPLLLYFVHKLYQSKQWRGFHGLAFAVAGQFFGGYAQYWIYNLGFTGLYAVYLFSKTDSDRLSFLAKTAGAIALGILLSLPQIVPFYSALKTSPRSDPETAKMYEGRNHLSPRKLITLAVPDFFGHSETNLFSRLILKPPVGGLNGIWERMLFGEYPSLYNRVWGYVGLLTLFFALFAFVQKEARFWIVLGLLPLALLILLNFSMPRTAFRMLWDGFDRIDHTRSIVIAVFSFAVLGGYGFQSLLSNKSLALKRGKFLLTVAVISAVILGCIYGFLSVSGNGLIQNATAHYEANKRIAPWNENSAGFVREGIAAIPEMIRSTISILVIPLALTILFAALLMLFGRSRMSEGLCVVMILGVTILDLGFHGRFDPPLYFSTNAVLNPQFPPSLKFLETQMSGFRVLEIQRKKPPVELPLQAYADLGLYRTRGPNYFDFQSFDFVARPDILLHYGFQSAGGYLSIYPGAIRDLWNARANDNLQFARDGELIDRWSGGWIDLQSIRFILADPGAQSTVYSAIYTGPDLTIFENKNALPRAWIVNGVQSSSDALEIIKQDGFAPRQSVVLDRDPGIRFTGTPLRWNAQVVKSEPSDVVVNAETDQNSVLVLNDTFDAGWKAFVDGKSVTVYRANSAFRGVPLSPGQHAVEFKYRPGSFFLSLWIAGISLILWAGLALFRTFSS